MPFLHKTKLIGKGGAEKKERESIKKSRDEHHLNSTYWRKYKEGVPPLPQEVQ
jgi:hypothetical protein